MIANIYFLFRDNHFAQEKIAVTSNYLLTTAAWLIT
jgi:hypothetical protein